MSALALALLISATGAKPASDTPARSQRAVAAPAAQPKVSLEERLARYQQTLDELDSPDSMERLLVFNDIIAGNDELLKTQAAKKVLAGNDVDLRKAAIGYALSRKVKYTLIIDTCAYKQGNPGQCESVAKSGNQIALLFSDFNKETGEFKILSNYSSRYGRNNVDESKEDGRIESINTVFVIDIGLLAYVTRSCNGRFSKIVNGAYYGSIACESYQIQGHFELF